MATATADPIEDLRKKADAARDKANALGAELREVEEREGASLDEKRAAAETTERERLVKEEEEREAKRLAVLKTKAEELDNKLRDAWPLIRDLFREQNIPHEYHQKAREAYMALARFYKKED